MKSGADNLPTINTPEAARMTIDTMRIHMRENQEKEKMRDSGKKEEMVIDTEDMETGEARIDPTTAQTTRTQEDMVGEMIEIEIIEMIEQIETAKDDTGERNTAKRQWDHLLRTLAPQHTLARLPLDMEEVLKVILHQLDAYWTAHLWVQVE